MIFQALNRIANVKFVKLLLFLMFLQAILIPSIEVDARLHWSYEAHGDVSIHAVNSLPSPWKEFFQNYTSFLSLHSNDPDEYRSWCQSNDPDLYAAEGPRHYDDHNLKEYGGVVFNESLPSNAHLIDAQYTSEDLDFVSLNVPVSSDEYKKGVIEWTVSNFSQILTYYMSAVSEDPLNNTAWQYVLTTMSWLSHYVADATMPLHATANYNGQLTGQYGIHGAIESTLLPDHSQEIAFSHSLASYTSSAFNQTIFSIESGLALVSDILETDKILAPDGIRDSDWSEFMWNSLGEELSDRIDRAAVNTANLWYSSLIDSGLITALNSTHLNSLVVNLNGIPDPWRPPIPSNIFSPLTTSSFTASTEISSTTPSINETSQKNTSWILSPILLLVGLNHLVRRKQREKR